MNFTVEIHGNVRNAPAGAHAKLIHTTVQRWLEQCHSSRRIQGLEIIDDDATVADVLGIAASALEQAMEDGDAVCNSDLDALDWPGRWGFVFEPDETVVDSEEYAEPDLVQLFDDGGE